MNVLDKRESDMLTRYNGKLQSVHLTNPNSMEYSDVIVILSPSNFSCWCS